MKTSELTFLLSRLPQDLPIVIYCGNRKFTVFDAFQSIAATNTIVCDRIGGDEGKIGLFDQKDPK